MGSKTVLPENCICTFVPWMKEAIVGSDFGQELYGHPCSNKYWDSMKGSQGGYVPFVKEMYRAFEDDRKMPEKMVSNLIGVLDGAVSHRMDASHDKKILSIYNKAGSDIVPTDLIAVIVDRKGEKDDSFVVYLDKGWQIGFTVLPDSRFSVHFIGIPAAISELEDEWIMELR